jgi:hypothetical protein
MANSSFFKDGGADSGTFASLDSKLAAAEASKVAAEAAKVAAEQAETDAQTAEANALSHANTALQNQQSTSAHVTQTTNNATGAQQSATAAQSSEDDARKLAVEPEDSQYALSNGTIGYSALHYSEKADDSAVSAAASVVTAAGHVSTASGHATTAGGHASTASGHAATAATKATDATASAAAALQSEQNAAQSETNAAQSANTASGHEANASTSENNSANSAQAAGSSASAATTSANTASGHATNAGNSATASANSATASSNSAGSAASAQTAAEAARDSALAALDSFDDRYLGVKSSDPTLDNDGNALVSGALYFSSTTTSMKVFDGSNWLNAYASLSGALIAANNLSDLNNAGTARTNLGLASVAASGAYGDLTGAPSLSSYITNNVSGDFTVDSGTLFVDAATNRVGINLGSGVSPTVPLNVAGTARFQSTTSAGQMLELTNYSGVSKFYRSNGRLEFQAGNNSNDQLILGNTGGLTFGGNDVLTSASTIDAATLDGIDSTSFLRSDTDDSVSANISFGDNNKAIFGAGSDLEIYHNGTDSFIDEKASGWLYIRANDMVLGKYTGETYVKGIADGAVELYHDNAKKIETTSTGASVTGGLTVNLGTDAFGKFANNISEVGSGNLAFQVANTAESALKPFGIRAEDVRIATGSSERLRVDSAGDVLLGNTVVNPASGFNNQRGFGYDNSTGKVEIASTSGLALSLGRNLSSDGHIAEFRKESTGVGDIQTHGGKLQIGQGNANVQFSNADDAIIPTNGNGTVNDNAVSLGTASARFHDMYAGGSIFATGTDYQVMVRQGSNQPWYLRSVSDGSFRVHLNGTGDIANFTSGGMQVSGKLTINQFSSSSKFQFLNGSSAQGIQIRSLYAGTTYASDGSADGIVDVLHGYRVRGTAAIDSDRNATFKNGTFDNGASTTLSVRGSGTGTAKIWARGSNQATGMVMVSQDDDHGGGIEYNGDNNPSTTGAGADQIALFRVSSGTYSWTARNSHGNNDWSFRGNVTAYASDERLKENIETIPNALDKVCKLRGVTFDWKDDCEDKGFMPTMKHETGVLAQNVQSQIPDAAVPAPFNDEYLTVKHEKIIPVLIEAVKELKAEIEELKKG